MKSNDAPKTGDLVDFYTNSWVMDRDEYRSRNPGLVLASKLGRHEILWSNGTRSIEHKAYLRTVDKRIGD